MPPAACTSGSTMELWTAWNACVLALRPACTRQATFEWMRVVLMGRCVRADLAGVPSLVRALALRPKGSTGGSCTCSTAKRSRSAR